MKKYVTDDPDSLTADVRNLLSVAYKNVVGTRRSAWRVISSIEGKSDNDANKKEVATAYRKEIEAELKKICGEVIVSLSQYSLLCF